MGVFDKEEYIDRLIKAYITYPIFQADVPKEKRSNKCVVFREDLEKLINKNKEQEADIHSANCIINEYIESDKEQEKIIELMAKEMSEEDENFLYRNTSDIIDYFKKKARDENGNRNDN